MYWLITMRFVIRTTTIVVLKEQKEINGKNFNIYHLSKMLEHLQPNKSFTTS